MPVSKDLIELITQLSVERDAYKRFTDTLCEMFSVPEEERQKPYVSEQIIDRIHQMQTGYTIRKSVHERDTGAAFRTPPPPDVTKDPVTQITDAVQGKT